MCFPKNVARNSLASLSKFEIGSLELQRFPAVSKNYRLKLCAKFVWAGLPSPAVITAKPYNNTWD